MSFRFMRVLLFFDLPSVTSAERREYTNFRKYLLKSGFLMLQESVYCKLALNQTVVNSILESLRAHKPPEGHIMALMITEKQFANIELIIGENRSEVINTVERLVII